MLLDVIADRVLEPTPAPLSHGEPDRLAWPPWVLRRRLVPLRIIEPWLARVPPPRLGPPGDPS